MIRPKRQRRPEDRPDEILDAALAVFTEQGFAAARVDDIAKRAGLSKGAVYLYFPSKDAMLNALVEQSAGLVAQSAERMVAASAPDDPEQAFRAVLRMVLTVLSDPEVSAAPRLVLSEAPRFPELAAYYRTHVIDIGQRAFRALFAAGIARGTFRAVDPDAAMRTLMGPVIAHMLLTTVFNRPGDPDHDPGVMADALADIVLNGLKPRPGDAS
ncbi:MULTISPECIES: TetR/AcrR family transcriptional regulator [Hyphobacterium]|uniref:TetR/AcrR family transcriptional regulator n=1 Tax=Hyphobacterium vulgare TaxID=1736751 RepID=A0ABV6ZY87_9PROT